MILFRHYKQGILTHSIGSTNGPTVTQGIAPTKDLIDSYLCTNGKPIKLGGNTDNQLYRGDKTCANQMINRDPRLSATIYTDKFYVNGMTLPAPVTQSASSGFRVYKFLDVPNQNAVSGSNNDTDAPVIRLGEVMLNYIEACAELADMGLYTVTQNDINITINALRNRSGFAVKLPNLEIINGLPAVGGETYDDYDRDPTVPPFIWEIRRERRVELVYEGYRLTDIKRWRKLDYCKTDQNYYPKKNLGAWVEKAPGGIRDITLADINGIVTSPSSQTTGEGYIKISLDDRTEERGNVRERAYLEHVPTIEISYYLEKAGVVLTQNPGWQSILSE